MLFVFDEVVWNWNDFIFEILKKGRLVIFNRFGKSNVLVFIFMFVFLLYVLFIYINDKKINKDLIYKFLVVIFFGGGGDYLKYLKCIFVILY